MNGNLFRYVISMALLTSCTDLPKNPAATASAPTPTPENYGLYTDADLQIYADTIDQRIQQALKNNDTNQAQELGLKRQELIAEFRRRGLKRKPTETTDRPHHLHRLHHPETGIGTGLPGQN
jgi:transcriptional regulator with GAF, ATPase, and Fis domain